jgi:hypothetical protein
MEKTQVAIQLGKNNIATETHGKSAVKIFILPCVSVAKNRKAVSTLARVAGVPDRNDLFPHLVFGFAQAGLK